MNALFKSRTRISALVLPIALVLAGCFDQILYESETTGTVVGSVAQTDSGAKVRVRQAAAVDSAFIDPTDGSFRFDDLPMGNYVLEVEAPDFSPHALPVSVDGGRITYIGEIDLSKIPHMVASFSPADNSEVVLVKGENTSNLSVSINFSTEMDRASIEEALSIVPPVAGTFRWNQYIYQLQGDESWEKAGYALGGQGAQITTYSHIHALTFLFSPKDSFADTTYQITLSPAAHDTAGTPLALPLRFSFGTIQAASSLSTIQTVPYDGQRNVAPICPNGLRITFPKRMDPTSVEEHLSILPATDPVFLWPEGNQMTIWTGGLLVADTTYSLAIDAQARDLDGAPLGEDFTFSFTTAAVGIVTTNPQNGALFVDPQPEIELHFNSWMSKNSVEDAFAIEPAVSGQLAFMQRSEYYSGGTRWVIEKDKLKFVPSGTLSPNTKYTITLAGTAVDFYGSKLTPYTFAFITRPE
ncbi:MAG: Ig-like domain-containing protein [Candidatus Latescibacterota bacterium]